VTTIILLINGSIHKLGYSQKHQKNTASLSTTALSLNGDP
jgi:hypothetical protein